MPRRRVFRRALLVTPGLSAASLGLVLQLTSSWRLVRIPWLDPLRHFEDLWQVTSNADCAAANPHWSPATSTCDPWERPYNYPVVWAKVFGGLGLGRSDTEWLGIAMIVVFGLTVVALAFLTLRSAPIPALVLLTVSAVSPPALVAMERGNIDLLTLPWVVVGLWLMSRQRWAAALPMLAAAGYLKVFPLGALAGVLARRRGGFLLLAAATVAFVAPLAIEADQFSVIIANTPQGPAYSWGVSVLPLAATSDDSRSRSPYLLGIAFFGLCLAVGLLSLRLRRSTTVATSMERTRLKISGDPVTEIIVSAGLGLVLFTYLLGANFDYRMIVLTVLVAGLLRCWADPACRRIAVGLVCLQFVSYPLTYPWELVGDVAWAGMAPVLALLSCWLWFPIVRSWIQGVAPDESTDLPGDREPPHGHPPVESRVRD